MGGLTLLSRGDGRPPVVVALGAHCDDVEIGAGALLLQLAESCPGALLQVLVLSSTPDRESEAHASLKAFGAGLDLEVTVLDLPDGRLPAHWDAVKEALEGAGARARAAGGADLVLSPCRQDLHQDHRLVAELTPTVFRDHLVLGYEIAKWDGDLGRPAVHLPVPAEVAARKFELLAEHYPSQRDRDWFDREAFLGLMRLRGVECHQRYAEAYWCDKIIVGLPPATRSDREVPCAS
ncbi:PIG-L deacetylase family protein [Geodermatophilus obscurus]|uniref:LmbE family protein n=1 Tax=Geodermatophilus obscurus (strain ATCC 25078 / DSM 43160 / JCM 3152 / CCUG 61914 / KCC A-0152 / KCTC 9177 / NBRC 13315 / NRRL B-3577 / G-20) TaxID=526225 RepID=D2S551_GEOOG|nr:PIG-L family deacetylase [Geodermatophilus obscurus]ADB73162.1 LmbE family protein [Geodermatophilus obscurus DSM 43160]